MPPKDARDVDGALKDDVKLESLSLAADAHTLDGSVLVRNIAFEKRVAARFTLDAWQTTSEVTARYLDSPAPSTIDRFVFKVRLSDMLGKIVGRTMEIALRYEVAGRELWDNNARENYRVVFEKAVSKPAFVASPE
ncbi:carbohydrate-binding module family 21 protein, partial [Botryobasidium botryosum FD-172 SS1]